MRLLVLIGLLLLIGCAPQPMQPRVVDHAFETYVQSFEAIWEHIANMSIEFSTLGGDLAGLCTVDMNSPYAEGTRTIQVDSTYWNEIDSNGQEQLLYHELGHCALGRMHWSAESNNYPLTIMYPVAFGNDGYYALNRAYYVGELFANNPAHEDPGQGSIPAMGDDKGDYLVKNSAGGQ